MVTDGPTGGGAGGGAAVASGGVTAARGGVSVEVGAACRAVADHLAADPSLVPTVWLARGGRLRCMAARGAWHAPDGIPTSEGIAGQTYPTGAETVLPRLTRGLARPTPAEHAGDGAGVVPAVGTVGAVTVGTGAPAADALTAATAGTGAPAADALTAATATTAAPVTTDDAAPNAAHVARICVPVRSGDEVVGALDVRLRRTLRPGDTARIRRAAARLGETIAALGGPPRESAPQRLLRHVARLSDLDDGTAIAGAVLAATRDLVPLDSAAIVRRAPDGALAPVCTSGPLADALGATPPDGLATLAGCLRAASSCLTVADPDEPWPATLDRLRAAGARALVAVGLVAGGELEGILLLASCAPARVSTDDIELLELLAAHGASALRTADLVRSLRERAATDPLTGLGHHATFHEQLAAAHRRPTTAVVVCDLDGFKRINDTFGHQHGDHVLRAVATALTGALRRGDTLFRIGGDEFAALLAVCSPAEALEAGQRLRDAVEAAALGVTVSIGVAIPRDGESDAAVLARADAALYRVKQRGRDGVALAGDDARTTTPDA